MKVNALFLLVIALLFLSGPFVKAGPVGDFFKKVGQSISKPLQREPQAEPPPQSAPPQTTKSSRATRRSASRAAPSAAPGANAEPSQAPKEESVASVRHLSTAEIEKIKAGLPYGAPVPGRKGMVTSPYTPEDGKYIDVTGFSSGSIVKDPYTGKFFLVP